MKVRKDGVLMLCAMIIFVGRGYSASEKCVARKQAALFVFGASLFDVGSNNYINTVRNARANFWPYGESFFKYPSGRFSNGRVIPDFIAEYADLPFTLPYAYPNYQQYTHGVNFASGGAGALVELHKGYVTDLKTQLENFKNVNRLLRKRHGDSETKNLVSNAIYLFNIGFNDYSARVLQNSSLLLSYTPEKYVSMVVGNLTRVVKEIHKIGGRKFGFLGMPPLGCVPSFRVHANGSEGSCLEEASTLAKLHNTELSEKLHKLERYLEGFKYSVTHYYDIFMELMNFPSKYGFKEGKVACCGSGPYRGYYTCGGRLGKKYEVCENSNDHVFFDSSHPTERANQIFAHQMWFGTSNSTVPYNLKTLFQL
ncbi:GDSL esterase/lipase 1-like isoform X2 [Prosopis cineraria]|uniref:GDSL esterase/lipase 1-like isoform X2 n=1 Tax=Prosopis cineraria TaxID=364024 RepID=UPI0024106B55|nr:GDSL esterase/lipase 1-like isoform X2 [Prosopis cineraria]